MITKTIITPSKNIHLTWCDKGCVAFHPARIFGIVPAYCMCEGKIINTGNREVGCVAFNRGYYEVGYPIPKWCPLPAGDCS